MVLERDRPSDFSDAGFDSMFSEPDRPAPVVVDFTGELVDGYRFEKCIADQPASQVYLARDHVLQRLVAAKVLKRGDWMSSDCSQRFLSEGRILASLKHPNIVQIHGFSTIQGLPCLFMEYIPDGTLANYLDGPCNPLEAGQILLRIARGVACAHNAGIVHRDLKPQNVLIDRSINEPALQTQFGFVKVTDFGIAKVLEDFESVTLTGMQPGTLVYMSPEQVNSEKEKIGPASDVFSLGIILYMLVTGEHPFSTPSVPDTLKNILKKKLPALSDQVSAVPPWLDEICKLCLEKDVANRCPDAEQLALRLEAELAQYARTRNTVVSREDTATRRGLSGGTLFIVLSVGLLIMAALSVVARIWNQNS